MSGLNMHQLDLGKSTSTKKSRAFEPMSGEWGKEIYVLKHRIRIDPTYQREYKEHWAKDIAKNFDKTKFGRPSVVLRGDGFYYATNGQHRIRAAQMRTDIDSIPVIVRSVENVVEEAKQYLDENSLVRRLSVGDKFNALAVTGDPAASLVNELVTSVGRTIAPGTTGKNTVACVQSLIRAANKNRDILTRVWPLIAEIAECEPITQPLVFGIFHLEHNMPEGRSLTEPRLWKKLVQIGAGRLLSDYIIPAAKANGGANPKACAEGVLRYINRNLRDKIEIWVGED